MASKLSSLILLAISKSTYTSRPATDNPCCNQYNIGYDPIAAANQAKRLSTHSWEHGYAAEALLELYNPELAVFSPQVFRGKRLPRPNPQDVESLRYVRPHIRLNSDTLADGEGATGDPASLGYSALLIGQTERPYLDAAQRQFDHFNTIPRWQNGAESHREGYPELWADFIAMAPPFFAAYAVSQQNDSFIRQAVGQPLNYRQVLAVNVSRDEGEGREGQLWKHIVGPRNQDLGLWSTGNGWAAFGMVRVLATLVHWLNLGGDENPRIAAGDLFHWVGEILEGARRAPRAKNGLLRNYLGPDETWFGETSGTALLTAVVFRLFVLQERTGQVVFDAPGSNYTRPITYPILRWAEENRRLLAAHVNKDGIASPAVNPLDWKSRTPVTTGSPEGQSFLVLMYAAWRDCVKERVCSKPRNVPEGDMFLGNENNE